MSRSEIRIAGAGGQGIVTAGRILAESAILSGSNAAQNQVYGPQSRGGASRSDVVIATEEIGFPLAENIDFLVALSGEAYSRYRTEVGEECRLIVDSRCAPPSGNEGEGRFPVVDTARAVSGGELVTGVVALGVLQALTRVVDAEALRSALVARVPDRHREMNLEALSAGMQLAGGRAA
jgi:2-oxoglutarate ferredoxin oxidoreductase subunit gamma